ncbi:methylated-DNA--[protein]-cysteine S-methyltransferase [Symbiobacterium thermophilum]|uniref:methylated-DNA--[protein]-cysteine S-methyltransferase n=1 Tax=Symbiobacterium thermophilum (strain DSM 24528 / JCM 14929 / IAM 14863 / T) TaxID=292459 RepID=Q67QN2_SYMTH|nr:methylated-DNA--[protein]-cysteine S-methyltransferase [Symbiobacterium thermophilum]BAD40011.1 putative DNA-methyltransferase [Symbiobacterium thermophilum IAM 14863]
MEYTCCETRLGPIYVAWTAQGIACVAAGEGEEEAFRARCRALTGQSPVRNDGRRAELERMLQGWLEGEPYDGPVDLSPLSPFDREVLAACRAIPRGEVRTYGELAAAVGRPRAARAVGGALRRNPVPLLIPCHRVVRSDGTIGQYSMGGPEVKRQLLAMEGAR